MQRERLTPARKRLLLACMLVFLLIPALLVLGASLLRDRQYHAVSLLIALLACLPFFVSFERRRPPARELVVIGVMSAIAAGGRLLFALAPGFKPVTALVAVTGAALGPEAGFLTGAVTALASNLFFGQGPWTPFQMLAWGLCGFFAGLFARAGWMEKRWFLVLYGVLAGAGFSLCMDVWTVLSLDNGFRLSRYLAVTAASLPMTAEYAFSNVLFLLTLYRPFRRKLARLRLKYGIGD